MVRNSRKKAFKLQYRRKQNNKTKKLRGGVSVDTAKTTLLTSRSSKISDRMNDLKLLLGLMDDEQWKILTYRLALLCKNEDLSTLKTPDLKIDNSQSLDLSKKQMDSLIKSLQGPGYNITQMNLDELSKAHTKYESL